MSLPPADALPRHQERMQRDCRTDRAEAEQRGDLREAGEFREHLQRVESMIKMNGGDAGH